MATAYWASEYSLIRVLESEEWSGGEPEEGADDTLDIVVLHTSDSSTRRALKTASTLAAELSARVHFVAPCVVPFALDLHAPPVPVSFTACQLRQIAEDAGVDAAIDVILCRDLMPALSAVLSPRSLIVVGQSRLPWWRRFGSVGRENRLAQRLRAVGHQVVSADVF